MQLCHIQKGAWQQKATDWVIINNDHDDDDVCVCAVHGAAAMLAGALTVCVCVVCVHNELHVRWQGPRRQRG